jgi:DNA (cytosine-5)-methyltransferase 1
MMRPLLLDLFAGAGGAAAGYRQAGFDVVGVDIEPQPRYPFHFVQMDAFYFLRLLVNGATPSGHLFSEFSAIHASPPCHDHSTVSGRNRKAARPKGTGWMLAATIDRLAASGLPYIVENVGTADFGPAVYRVRLCGSSFGLDVRRHRWFASNIALISPPCAHGLQRPRFRSLDSRQKTPATVVGVHGHLNYAGEFELRCRAMGIDWMSSDELSQAIPPAYTYLLGEQLMAHLRAVAA